MTELVLMRHGHALSRTEAGVASDSERPLSPLGEKAALEAAMHLNAAGFTPDLIVSSPFARAARTAEIASGVFAAAGLKTAPALSDGPAQAVIDLLGELSANGSRVLVVGHQPLMGAIAGYYAGQAGFDLSPAGFVRIDSPETPGSAAVLEFYEPPPPKD